VRWNKRLLIFKEEKESGQAKVGASAMMGLNRDKIIYIYTVSGKKRCHLIFYHNFAKS